MRASWIVKKIINNKGGLHNRITMKIQLSAFNLQETKEVLLSKDIKLNNMQITQLYMVTGGIPYYLSAVQRGLSVVQIIEHLAFKQNSILYNEFDNLFASLFQDATPYINILKTIAKHHYWLGQEELVKQLSSISKGGRLSEKLAELEEAGFILQFIPHLHKKRGIYYRVIDEYTMFYLKWIEPLNSNLQKRSLEEGYWQQERNSPTWNSWVGYAFESICYKHISQIRKKLKILPNAIISAWRFVPTSKSIESSGAQIDLLFDRKDDAVTVCEIKYCEKSFVIDKNYAKILQNKIAVFVNKTKTRKQIILAMITANGLKDNIHADLVDAVVTLDDLFI